MRIKEHLWRKVHEVSLKKIRENHLDMGYCDMKCPFCHQWASLVGFELESKNQFQDRYRCSNCGKVTAWHMDAPVPFIVPIEYFPNKSNKPKETNHDPIPR